MFYSRIFFIKIYLYIFLFFLIIYSQTNINISGTVKDVLGNPIRGAIVSIVGQGKSCVTDEKGIYSIISGNTLSKEKANKKIYTEPYIWNNKLFFQVFESNSPVRITLFSISGKHIAELYNNVLPKGDYNIPLLKNELSPMVYIIKGNIGNEVYINKFFNAKNDKQNCFLKTKAVNNNTKSYKTVTTFATIDSMFAGSVGYNTVSKAIDSYIGTVDFILERTVSQGNAFVVQTSQAGDRLALKQPLAFTNDDGTSMATMAIDTSQKYQKIVGFGAAFTEAAVYCMSNIGESKRKEIMDLFFNPYSGAGFTMGRTQIGASDFSVSAYFYSSTSNDFELNDFSIDHEKQWMIPMIKQAKSVPGSDIKIFASPWSPPPWMKTTNNWLHGTLRNDCYAAFALYLCKYVLEMKANGIDIWGITMQNEPAFDSPWYPSCTYTPQQQRDFLKNYFGPQLERDKLFPGIKVMIWDHNKDLLNTWGDVIIGDSACEKYVWGAAYHWYSGDMFDRLTTFHGKFPTKYLIETEVAEPFKGTNPDGSYKTDWGQAERECHDLIGDMNNWSNGWNEWNLCVDEKGGPGYTGSVGSAPIMTNLTNKTYFVQPHYYMMAHFSKYVRPDAIRIGFTTSSWISNVEATTFKNVNGTIVIVIMNRTANLVTIKLKFGANIIKPSLPAHSFTTIIF